MYAKHPMTKFAWTIADDADTVSILFAYFLKLENVTVFNSLRILFDFFLFCRIKSQMEIAIVSLPPSRTAPLTR